MINSSGNTSFNNKAEIIYHVFQRSFYDSNNDKHGDLTGLKQQLPYLQELGSPFFTHLFCAYHYIITADDFEARPAYEP